MKTREILASLVDIAQKLDTTGHIVEADQIDQLIVDLSKKTKEAIEDASVESKDSSKDSSIEEKIESWFTACTKKYNSLVETWNNKRRSILGKVNKLEDKLEQKRIAADVFKADELLEEIGKIFDRMSEEQVEEVESTEVEDTEE